MKIAVNARRLSDAYGMGLMRQTESPFTVFPSDAFLPQPMIGVSMVKLLNSNDNIEGRPPSSTYYERTMGGET